MLHCSARVGGRRLNDRPKVFSGGNLATMGCPEGWVSMQEDAERQWNADFSRPRRARPEWYEVRRNGLFRLDLGVLSRDRSPEGRAYRLVLTNVASFV